MDVRLLAAVTGSLEGVNVSELCATYGTSRKTFYKWRARYAAGGAAALEPMSRRPARSPARLPAEVEDRIVELRKQLDEDGHYAGAATIHWHLRNQGVVPVPSEATIWRVLVRRGFITPEPKKRPRAAVRRFEAAAPNECWQIDATHFTIASGPVEIINIIDDHSRLVVASVAVASTTTDAAWAAFTAAALRWGLPVRCLSDNGLAFSGRLRGIEVAFETNLRAVGIRPVTSRPFHPQTCGKVERFQQTLKKWLRARPRPAQNLTELQAQIDTFITHYNHHRPHRGIGRVTPHQRWTTSPAAAPDGTPIPAPARRTRITVNPDGRLRGNRWDIAIGVDYAGLPADIILQGDHVAVFIHNRLVRTLTLDPNRYYQPSGNKPGGPRRPRPT